MDSITTDADRHASLVAEHQLQEKFLNTEYDFRCLIKNLRLHNRILEPDCRFIEYKYNDTFILNRLKRLKPLQVFNLMMKYYTAGLYYGGKENFQKFIDEVEFERSFRNEIEIGYDSVKIEEVLKYVEQLKKEVELMKNYKICDSRSLFDFFTCEDYKYLANTNLMRMLKSVDYKSFPEYEDVIKRKLMLDAVRYKLTPEAIFYYKRYNQSSNHTSVRALSYELYEKIFDNLDIHDLRNFILCYKPAWETKLIRIFAKVQQGRKRVYLWLINHSFILKYIWFLFIIISIFYCFLSPAL